ncbi:MAG: hypothetical protein JWQ71_5038 [Pedosphaera sp.]|nr:hypothetical protein [Pedosphaera sp.]
MELIVTALIVATVMVLFLPALARPKQHGTRMECVNNLKQNSIAFRIWSDDNGDKLPMEVLTNMGGTKEFADGSEVFRHFQVMSNELGDPRMVICPVDRQRKPATNWTTDFNNIHVSFFIGRDAKTSLTNSFLAGDRNLKNGQTAQKGILEFATNQPVKWGRDMHKENGDVLFVDGSVKMLSSAKVKEALGETGTATNRLVFP